MLSKFLFEGRFWILNFGNPLPSHQRMPVVLPQNLTTCPTVHTITSNININQEELIVVPRYLTTPSPALSYLHHLGAAPDPVAKEIIKLVSPPLTPRL